MRVPIFLLLAVVSLGGCGRRAASPGVGAATDVSVGGQSTSELATLRLSLAQHPRGIAVNRAMATLQARRGRSGAALRHLSIVARRGALTTDDRRSLARLYLARAAARATLGDPASYLDLERAVRLHKRVAVPAPLRARLYDLAGIAELSSLGDSPMPRGARLLARGSAAGMLAGAALVAPGTVELEALGDAGLWVYRRGARRVGLTLLERYRARGGKRVQVVAALLYARHWWGARRPSLVAVDSVGSSLDVCRFAVTLDDFACAATVVPAAASATESARLLQRARRGFWRDARSANAGGWVAIALRARVVGTVDSWLAETAARIDIDHLDGAGMAAVPGWALATVLRAAGNAAAAQVALDAAARVASTLTPMQRAVVLAEAIQQRRAASLIDFIAQSGSLEITGLTVAAVHARSAGTAAGRDREMRLVGRMAPKQRRLYLEHHGDVGRLAGKASGDRRWLARWYRIAGELGLTRGRDHLMSLWQARSDTTWPRTTSLGVVDPMRVMDESSDAVDDGLVEIVVAYLREPARADRLAEDYVDRAVAIGQRGPRIARLFVALADPVRADRWWRRVTQSSPRHPGYLAALGVSAAATGDLARAGVALTAAAAASSDPGQTARAVAKALAEQGHFVAALGAAKRAIELTAPAYQSELLLLIAHAALQLGRTSVAAGALARFVARVGPRNRPRARAFAAARWPKGLALPAHLAQRPRRADSSHVAGYDGVTAALARLGRLGPVTATAELRRAIAWSPGDVSARAALLARTADPKAREVQLAALLAMAVAAPPRRAARALSLLAKVLPTQAGRVAARKELRGLTALRLAVAGELYR